MKSTLRRLNTIASRLLVPLLALGVAVVVVLLLSRLTAGSRGLLSLSSGVEGSRGQVPGPSPAAPGGGGRSVPASGEHLLLSAINQLVQGPSVSARLHQRVELSDSEVLGVGAYRQEALKNGGRFNLQVRTKSSGLQIVSDGNHIWHYRAVGDTRRLTRIDLQEYERLTGNRRNQNPSLLSRDLPPRQVSPLELGGVPQILEAIARRYRFGSVKQTVLSDVPVYELRGRLASTGPPPTPAPPQVPSHVVLSLGQSDLFPYRVVFEYKHASHAEQQNGVPTRLQIQFSEVSFGAAIDNRWFEYSPQDIAWEDVTVERLSRTPSAS